MGRFREIFSKRKNNSDSPKIEKASEARTFADNYESFRKSRESNYLRDVESGNLNISTTIVKLPPREVKHLKSKVLSIILLLGFLAFFFYFYYRIIFLDSANLSFLLTLYAFNFVFLFGMLQILFKKRNFFDSRGVTIPNLLKNLIPTVLGFSVLFYSFFINSPWNALENFNNAMEEKILIAFPILLFLLLAISICKTLFRDSRLVLSDVIELFKLRKYENNYSMLRHQLYNHISYSCLILFLISVLSASLKILIIVQIIFDLAIIIAFNWLYYKNFHKFVERSYKRHAERLKRKKEESELNFIERIRKHREEKEKHEGFISYKSFVVVVVISFLIMAYFFNIFGLQAGITQFFIIVFKNNLVFGLTLLVFIFFVIYPIGSIVFLSILKIFNFLYERGLKHIIYIIFAYFTIVLLVKVFFFNLDFVNLDSSLEWIISYSAPVLLFLAKKFTKKAIKKAIK